MPTRRFNRGPRPGLNSRDVLSKEIGADSQWVFPETKPEGTLRRRLLAKVLEVGARTSFKEHIYTFGDKIFHQSGGGPIGSGLTMVCARLIMIWWMEKVHEKLKTAGLEVWFIGVYVDDFRFLLSMLEMGWRWNDDMK